MRLFGVELLTLLRVFRFTSHINPRKLMRPAGREFDGEFECDLAWNHRHSTIQRDG